MKKANTTILIQGQVPIIMLKVKVHKILLRTT